MNIFFKKSRPLKYFRGKTKVRFAKNISRSVKKKKSKPLIYKSLLPQYNKLYLCVRLCVRLTVLTHDCQRTRPNTKKLKTQIKTKWLNCIIWFLGCQWRQIGIAQPGSLRFEGWNIKIYGQYSEYLFIILLNIQVNVTSYFPWFLFKIGIRRI